MESRHSFTSEISSCLSFDDLLRRRVLVSEWKREMSPSGWDPKSISTMIGPEDMMENESEQRRLICVSKSGMSSPPKPQLSKKSILWLLRMQMGIIAAGRESRVSRRCVSDKRECRTAITVVVVYYDCSQLGSRLMTSQRKATSIPRCSSSSLCIWYVTMYYQLRPNAVVIDGPKEGSKWARKNKASAILIPNGPLTHTPAWGMYRVIEYDYAAGWNKADRLFYSAVCQRHTLAKAQPAIKSIHRSFW